MATGSDLVKKALNVSGKDGYYTGGLGKAFAVADVAGIVTADNKLQALGVTLKNLVAFNLFGWSIGIVGALFGIRNGITQVIRDSGTLEVAMRRVAAVRFYVSQFEPFLKGAAMAKQYVADLYGLAGKGFDMSSYVEAARSLTVYTRGLFSSTANVKSLADASVRAGQDIRGPAAAAGQLIAALREGRPIAQFAGELVEMGIVSSTAARQMEEIQSRGGATADVMGILQGELDKAKGAADEAGESMVGLKGKLDAARESLAAKFGEPFLKSEQEGIKNTIGTLNNLAPIAAAVAGPLSQVVTIGNNVMGTLTRLITSIPGLATAASVATRGIIAFSVAIGLWQGYRLLQGIIALGPGFAGMVRWLTSGQVAMNLQAAATTRLTVAQTLYAHAAETAAGAAEAEAAGNTALAASLTETAAAQERQAAVQMLASRGIGAVATGVTGLTTAMRSLLAATILNPWFLLIAALAALAGVVWHAIDAHQKHVQALNELQAAGQKVADSLDAQIRGMKTLDDQQQALIDSTNALAEARAELSKQVNADAPDDLIAAAYRNVQSTQKRVDDVKNAKGLAPSQRQTELNQRFARQDVDEDEAKYQARMAQASPIEQNVMREERMATNKVKLEQGRTLVTERTRVEDAEKTIQAQIPAAEKSGSMIGNRSEADILKEQLANVRLTSASPIIRGMAETDRDEKAGTITHDQAQDRRNGYEKQRYDLEDKMDSRRGEQVQLGSDKTQADRAAVGTQIDLEAEKEINAIRLRGAAAAEAEGAARIRALQTQLTMQQYLDGQQREAIQNKIDGETKALELMRQENALQREADASALAVARLNRDASVATARGNLGDAARLQQEAIRKSEEQSEKEDRRYAQEHGNPDVEGYVKDQRDNRTEQRNATRDEFLAQTKTEADLRDAQLKAAGVGLSKTGANAGQTGAAAALAAALGPVFKGTALSGGGLKSGGLITTGLNKTPADTGPSEREVARQNALRLGDRETARGRIEEALKKFASPEEAAAYAKKAGEQDITKETTGAGRGIIADSLQRIGLGGGVGGVDQGAELARRRTDLLSSINDILKKNAKQDTPPPAKGAKFGP